jgi:hypothetical protein
VLLGTVLPVPPTFLGDLAPRTGASVTIHYDRDQTGHAGQQHPEFDQNEIHFSLQLSSRSLGRWEYYFRVGGLTNST